MLFFWDEIGGKGKKKKRKFFLTSISTKRNIREEDGTKEKFYK